MIAATQTVNLTFQYGVTHAATAWNVLACVLFGLIFGYMFAFTQARAGLIIPPSLLAVRVAVGAVGLQVATVIGQSISTPANSLAYLGSHLAYIGLSVIYGVACGPGARLYELRALIVRLRKLP